MLCSFNIKYWSSKGLTENLIGLSASQIEVFQNYLMHQTWALDQEQIEVPGETFSLTYNLG